MSDVSAVPPENGPSADPADRPPLLRIWFGVRDEVSRGVYAGSGFGLMLLKYAVEAFVIFNYSRHLLLPWEFLNPLLRQRAAMLQAGPEWLGWGLFAWNLPFVWIAFSMSVRRAADAGRSPWLGMLVLVPVVNLVVMLALAFVGGDNERHWRPLVHSDAKNCPMCGEEIAAAAVRCPYCGEPLRAPRTRDRSESGHIYRHALMAIGVGLLIGLAMLGISVYGFELYGATLFFGTPLLMAAVSAFVFNRPQSQSWSGTMGVASLLMLAAGGVLLLFAFEGVICLVMAAPLVFPLGLIGGAMGKAIADSTATTMRQTFLVLLALPLLTGAESIYHPAPEYVVLSSVEIDAPPEVVWEHVVEFPELPEPDEWYFRAGVACPTAARIDGRGVGAIRHCEFTTGEFVEPITVWDEPRRLAFDVTRQPNPMRELSPYRHVHPPHMENATFQSRRGEFRLVRLSGGRTRLEGRTWYAFDMFPQGYWTLWSRTCIHRIHHRVLNHIKRLSEE
jgi:Polyketide cyclase / dehydrase and lipid transport